MLLDLKAALWPVIFNKQTYHNVELKGETPGESFRTERLEKIRPEKVPTETEPSV